MLEIGHIVFCHPADYSLISDRTEANLDTLQTRQLPIFEDVTNAVIYLRAHGENFQSWKRLLGQILIGRVVKSFFECLLELKSHSV